MERNGGSELGIGSILYLRECRDDPCRGFTKLKTAVLQLAWNNNDEW